MAEKKTNPDGLHRRQFLTGAGSAVITGAVAALTALESTGAFRPALFNRSG